MRGTLQCCQGVRKRPGIIPAYAGNTCFEIAQAEYVRDHPRVCGEHKIIRSLVTARGGSSPRMRGTLKFLQSYYGSTGIIPAYAGNTLTSGSLDPGSGDHPRVCGEHRPVVLLLGEDSGSSPRMRGTPKLGWYLRFWRGIIPAYAGNTVRALTRPTAAWDHPRVCGEHAAGFCAAFAHPGSSPRMRGTRVCRLHHGQVRGIIPAYAGNTPWPHPCL